MLCAAVAGAALVAWPYTAGWVAALLLVGAALGIQARLLCNLFDGMVAVEGGLRSKTGDLWNEVPDRVSDTLIIAGAGHAVAALPHAIELGWAAALFAALTAYIRVLGDALGVKGLFLGPMAKQQRMALLTGGCLATAASSFAGSGWDARWVLWAVLLLIALGSLVTAARRLRIISRTLEQRP